MLTIDGKLGEGGGQVLRTSLALSLVTGKPFRIISIRAGRKKPGLLRQHLTAVTAATRVGRARTDGAALGSQELTFAPSGVFPGTYDFQVGTAGSTTLVLQAILPPLTTSSGRTVLTLEGGTHNPFAPPFDFLLKAFIPVLSRMGPRIEANLERPGFYPAGGGRLTVAIHPSIDLRGFALLERGETVSRRARAIISKLPAHIAERELNVLKRRLGWSDESLSVEEVDSNGPGNAVVVELQSENVTEVFTEFGTKGIRAETVAVRLADAVDRYTRAGVPVGEHLADQLLIPLAMAGDGSFRTTEPTLHTRTNADVIRQFLNVDISMHEDGEEAWHIKVRPR